jgi:drug/metabolite transporter (DMT)-like permease
MLCGCAWFSAMGLLVRLVSKHADWQTVAFARSGIATLFALAIIRAQGTRLVFFRPRVLWIRSLAGSFSMLTTFYALNRMHTSAVLTLTNTFPAWVALLSWPLLGDRPGRTVWAAILISISGVAVVSNAGELGIRAGVPVWIPPASALAASGFTAVAMLGLNRLKSVAPMAVVAHFSAVSTVFAGVAYFVFERDLSTNTIWTAETLLLLFGVGATAVGGQVFLTLAFAGGNATKVSVVGLSQVVMVMAAEFALGWKSPTLCVLLGTLLVLGPIAYLMLRERRQKLAPQVEAEVAIE